ncbi:MAG: hypothetical protein ILP10_02060 [Lachnospiraceae bacterium]|nr:hypothetical protein [Lachnospiraceae bacterium]
MQLLVLILKKEKVMDEILKDLMEAGIKGGTILDGKGMAEELVNLEDLPMFGVLRRALKDEEKENCKVILFVLKDEQLVDARNVIKKNVNLNAPNSGIMFAIPITYAKGLGED